MDVTVGGKSFREWHWAHCRAYGEIDECRARQFLPIDGTTVLRRAVPKIVEHARATGKLIVNLTSDQPEVDCEIPITGITFMCP